MVVLREGAPILKVAGCTVSFLLHSHLGGESMASTHADEALVRNREAFVASGPQPTPRLSPNRPQTPLRCHGPQILSESSVKG
jgi:hypothetical protein